MTLTPDHIQRLTKALADSLAEGYQIHQMPDGTFRVYLPPQKALKRGLDYYTVDLMDHRAPCTCTAGRFGRRCRHLSLAEAQQFLTQRREAAHV